MLFWGSMALHVQGQREDPAETSPEDPAVLDAEANLQPWEHYIVKHCSGFQYRKCLKTAQEATDLREQDCVVAGLNRKKCDAPPAYKPDVSAALGGPRVAHRAMATPVRSGAEPHQTCTKAHVPPSSTTKLSTLHHRKRSSMRSRLGLSNWPKAS